MINCHLGGNLLKQHTYQKYEYRQKNKPHLRQSILPFTYQEYVMKGVSQ